MLSPQSTKVLLGYVVVTVQLHIFAVHENVFHELFFVAQSYELFLAVSQTRPATRV